MTPARLTLALLCLAPLALGAAPYLGSPWPGVALVALALVPQAWEAYAALRRATGQAEALLGRIEALEERIDMALAVIETLQAKTAAIAKLEDDVRSLNNRKAFGG